MNDLRERFSDTQPLVQFATTLLPLADLAAVLLFAKVDLDQAFGNLSSIHVHHRAQPLDRVEVQERVFVLDRLDEDVEHGGQQRRVRREKCLLAGDERPQDGEALRADGEDRILKQLERLLVSIARGGEPVLRLGGCARIPGGLAERQHEASLPSQRRDELGGARGEAV